MRSPSTEPGRVTVWSTESLVSSVTESAADAVREEFGIEIVAPADLVDPSLEDIDPLPAITEITYLQTNHTAYLDKLYNEPILANGTQTIDDYFSLADDVGNGSIKRKIRTLLGLPP